MLDELSRELEANDWRRAEAEVATLEIKSQVVPLTKLVPVPATTCEMDGAAAIGCCSCCCCCCCPVKVFEVVEPKGEA